MIRVTAPVLPVVTLDEMKAHLRVVHDDEDLVIQSLTDAAVAHLDGYRGVLGRAIMPQEWAVDVDAGTHRLGLPDVTGATVDAGDVTLAQDALGWTATVTEPCRITFSAQLPDDLLPAVQAAVRLWVEMHYDRVTGPAKEAFQAAFNALIHPVRWVRL